MQYRADIDGLRALAVLSVLIFHVDPRILRGGFIGVDIFFVISGYLITNIIWHRFPNFSFLDFYARRVQRLLPALYATLFATLLLGLAFLGKEHLRALCTSTVSALLSVSNIAFWLQAGYFDTSAIHKPLLHTWSLAVEEQFYLLWPLLLSILYSRPAFHRPLLVFPLIIALAFLTELTTHKFPSAAYFLAPLRAYEFLIGASLHLVPHLPPALQHVEAVFGAALIAASLHIYSSITRFPGLTALVPCIGTALVIHSPQSVLATVLSIPPFVALGRISYSVYLVHWPIIVIFRTVTLRHFVQKEKLFFLFAAIALGYALHHSVESRFRAVNRSDSKHGNLRIIARYLAVTLGLITVTLGVMSANATGYLKVKEITEAERLRLANSTETLDRNPKIPASAFKKLDYAFESLFRSPWRRTRHFFEDHKDIHGNRHFGWDIEYGNISSRPHILVIGDSHAARITPIAIDLSMRRNAFVTFWTASGCLPLFDVHHRSIMRGGKRTQGLCEMRQKELKSLLLGGKYHFDYIFVAGRWGYMYAPSRYGPYWVQPEFLIDNLSQENQKPPTRKVARARLEKALRSSMRALTNTGAKVVLFSQVPNIGINISGCTERPGAARAMAKGKQPRGCVGATRRVALKRLRFMEYLVQDIARKNPSVTAVVSSTYFCDNTLEDEKYCRSVYRNRLLYVDSTHLSTAGGLYFSRRWEADGYGGIQWKYRNPRLSAARKAKTVK